MLFSEQFGWRHNRCLGAVCNCLQTGNCGNHCFARTNITLNQSHHGVRFAEIAKDLVDNALLRACQSERQACDKVRHLGVATAHGRCRFTGRKSAQVLEAQVVREQFFKGQALLAGVLTGQQQVNVGIRRWPVQVGDGIGERGEIQLFEYRRWQ